MLALQEAWPSQYATRRLGGGRAGDAKTQTNASALAWFVGCRRFGGCEEGEGVVVQGELVLQIPPFWGCLGHGDSGRLDPYNFW
jgi:hypothetical protein